jgi:catechol 2,3-dioxygenase-like lactoylglutathione lyase family enzyme
MIRVTRQALGVAALSGALMLWIANASGQTAPAPGTGKGAVIGTGTFTAFVENMDRSLAFFHDVFGMDVPPLPESGERPYNRANPQLFAMFDIPGARERHQSARVPNTRVNVELMEIQDVDHRTLPLRVQDPGVATLVVMVRDLDKILGRLAQAHVAIVTPGRKPVNVADGARALLIRDLDNRFIELRQPASIAQTAPAGDIVDLRLSIAVTDMERTTRVYRDVLGFTVEGETPLTADAGLRALTGLSKAKMRRSRAQAPGSPLWIEFVEYKGVERSPMRARIQDRGAARLQLRVQNIDAMVSAMKSAGMTVVTQGGGPVPIPPNFNGALVADPDNFFLTPFEPASAEATARQARPAPATAGQTPSR